MHRRTGVLHCCSLFSLTIALWKPVSLTDKQVAYWRKEDKNPWLALLHKDMIYVRASICRKDCRCRTSSCSAFSVSSHRWEAIQMAFKWSTHWPHQCLTWHVGWIFLILCPPNGVWWLTTPCDKLRCCCAGQFWSMSLIAVYRHIHI